MLTTKEKLQQAIRTYLPLLPLMFAIGIIPLIVRIQYYDPGLATYSWFSTQTYAMDMFLYWKNIAMLQLDIALVVGYVYLIKENQVLKEKLFIPLGIYALFIVLSSICSVAPEQTWKGFYGMLESVHVVLGYCMVCYYAAMVIKNEKQLKVVIGALFAGVFILCGIGITQFLKNDFYMSDFGKELIFPAKYAGYKDLLAITMGVGRVYASLYNPNYVGVYGCLLLPFFIVLTFTAKKKWQSVLYFILEAMVLICIVGAKNKTAVLLFIPCLLFIAIYFGKLYWKRILVTYVLTFVVFIASNMVQGENSLLEGVMSNFTLNGVMETVDDEEYEDIQTPDYKLEKITLNDEDINIVYNGMELIVKYLHFENDSWKIEVTDTTGKIIPTIINETDNGYYLDDDRLDGLEFVFGVDSSVHVGFTIVSEGKEFFVYYSETDKTYYYTNYYGKRSKIFASETFDTPFFHIMNGFSGRGYIWSKSIPILKDTLLIGSGPDTYAFMFPQYDYVSLRQNGWETLLITKPHSLYLQIGIQTGVVSLVAFMVFYIGYFLQSFRLYWKYPIHHFSGCCGAAIWMGSMCYMMSGLLNDSTIGVSIIYWTLLGIGFACNIINKKRLVTDVKI